MTFTFETTLSLDGWMGTLLIPENIAAQLTQDKIKRVIATISAHGQEIMLHAGIIKKKGVLQIMVSKANQQALNLHSGVTISISMQEDTTKYQAPMTEELEAVLLSDYEAYELFEKLLPGKRRNIIFQIYGIKDSQKRIDVALNAMENLKVGNTNPFKFEKLL